MSKDVKSENSEDKKRKLEETEPSEESSKKPKSSFLDYTDDEDLGGFQFSDTPPKGNGPFSTNVELPKPSHDLLPSDPLGESLTPRQVFRSLPQHVRDTLFAIKREGGANSEKVGRLKFYLNNLMGEKGNPFPVVRLYKELLGPDQLGRVLNSGMVKKLDYYWEHWNLPPADVQQVQGKPLIEPGSIPWDKLERLRGKDDPKIIKEDPLDYKPEEINGVFRDPNSGQYVASTGTIKWIRCLSYLIHREGKKDKFPGFLELMKKYFGEEVVKKSMDHDATQKRIKRATANYEQEQNEGLTRKPVLPTEQEGKESKGSGVGVKYTRTDLGESEGDDLVWLMHNLTRSHLPGIDGSEATRGFHPETVQWIQGKIQRALALCISPDPLVRKLVDMYGDSMKQIFTADYKRLIRAGIRNLPATTEEPKLLISWLTQDTEDSSKTPAPFPEQGKPSSGLLAKPLFGADIYGDRDGPHSHFGMREGGRMLGIQRFGENPMSSSDYMGECSGGYGMGERRRPFPPDYGREPPYPQRGLWRDSLASEIRERELELMRRGELGMARSDRGMPFHGGPGYSLRDLQEMERQRPLLDFGERRGPTPLFGRMGGGGGDSSYHEREHQSSSSGDVPEYDFIDPASKQYGHGRGATGNRFLPSSASDLYESSRSNPGSTRGKGLLGPGVPNVSSRPASLFRGTPGAMPGPRAPVYGMRRPQY